MVGPEERFCGVFKRGVLPDDISYYYLFVNRDYSSNEVVKKNIETAKYYFGQKGFKILDSSYGNTLEMVWHINKLAEEGTNLNETEIYLDSSTFNRANLLTILFLLRKKYKVRKIHVFYTKPIDTNEKISSCALDATSVPFFGGDQSIDKTKLLLLLIGFEHDRPLYIWEKLEPSKTILAYGKNPTDSKYLEKNKKVVDRLKEEFECEVVGVTANDPFQASKDIEEILHKHSDEFNIFASPLNTKLQTIGLYLAWEKNPSTQIVYSQPEYFSNWLTIGVGETYAFDLETLEKI